MAKSFCFAGYPAAILFDAPNGKAKIQKLWGSFLPLTGKSRSGHLEVKFGKNLFWVKEAETQPDGVLEIMFLDVGQGDGCLVNIPQPGQAPRRMIIDAGAEANMIRFLKHKYSRAQRKPVEFDSFVITHPDLDHYFGFDAIFKDPDFSVKTVYHSGLVERVAKPSSSTLGKRKKSTVNGRQYVSELVATKKQLDDLLTTAKIGRKKYPGMLRSALDSGRVGDIRMINADDQHLPGCGPGDPVTIQVLGPVPEDIGRGQRGLRWLSNLGKTKNGHSIVLRLTIGKINVLLGGDLNIPAEDFLLEHYTGMSVPPKSIDEEEDLLRLARKTFESDFAKSCHHGSADFTEYFLKAVNAHATIVSSGDDEPHAHPRADTLGTIGKHSRGRRSLIFSTELSRSTKETITNARKFKQKLRDAAADLSKANNGGTKKDIEKAEKNYEKLLETIERSVSVFGAINLRTDGDRAVFAYKIERPKDAKNQWDIYKFNRDRSGELFFDSKH